MISLPTGLSQWLPLKRVFDDECTLQEQITYLMIDTHNHALAQTAMRNSHIAFPLKNRLVFSDVEDGWDAAIS